MNNLKVKIEIEKHKKYTKKQIIQNPPLNILKFRGEISISFSKGKYNYVVKEGMGMNSSGIRLSVYKSGENILNLSHDAYNDYESRLVEINFDEPSSPVFKLVKPVEPW